MRLLNGYLEDYIHYFNCLDADKIYAVINYLKNFDQYKKIYLIGNGGSFALAEHFAQDLLKKCYLRAIALTNLSNITAFSNDGNYSRSFSGQIENYADPEDCLICFSSSGNSENIINACIEARDWKMKIISFTGFDGGDIKRLSDFNIHVPSNDYGIVESMHSILFHYIIDELI
jgi:D-sedoheptulose 7-phosphate isomerase